MNRIRSLREYVDQLRALGEIVDVNAEVDWNLELGAITRRSYELRAPAPLFNNIKGIERGFRVLGAPAGLSGQKGLEFCRVALSLGFPPMTSAANWSRPWPRPTTVRRSSRAACRVGRAKRIAS